MRMQKRCAWLTVAAVAVGSIAALPATAQVFEEEDPTSQAPSAIGHVAFGEPELVGEPIPAVVAAMEAVTGVEDGNNVMYTTVNGSPAVFQVVDLETEEVLRTFPLDGVGQSWTHAITPDGDVYIGSSSSPLLYRYSPQSQDVELLAEVPGVTSLWSIDSDEDGNVYIGSFADSGSAKVVKWDSDSDSLVDLGPVAQGESYVRGLAHHDGVVYAGTGSAEPGLWAVDAETGDSDQIPIPDLPELEGATMSFVYGVDAADGWIFLYYTGSAADDSELSLFLAYNVEEERWSENYQVGYSGNFASPARDGQVYFQAGGSVWSFDTATEEIADTGLALNVALRNPQWVDVSDRYPDLTGESLMTIHYNGQVSYLNFEEELVHTTDPIAAGAAMPIHSLARGPDGNIYSSGYMGASASAYNPGAGEFEQPYEIGQAESIVAHGDEVIFGVYPGAHLYSFDTTRPPSENNPEQIHTVPGGQDRPYAAASVDDVLLIGTIPDYGALGGTLTIREGGGDWVTWTAEELGVPDQSITGVTYRDDTIYASTAVWGGLGVEPIATEAEVLSIDAGTGEVLQRVTLETSQGLARHVGELRFGPDNLLWAAAYGSLVALDPETLDVVKSVEVAPVDWSDFPYGHMWRPIHLEFGAGGLAYTTLGHELVVVDPVTLEHRSLAPFAERLALDDDGNLYYNAQTELARVSVQADEWGVLRQAIEGYVASGELTESLAQRLGTVLDLAERHLEGDRTGPAGQMVEEFLDRLDGAVVPDVLSEQAQGTLTEHGERLLADIS